MASPSGNPARPSFLADANLNSTLSLSRPETPMSSQSEDSRSDSYFSDIRTPSRDDGTCTPITPSSTYSPEPSPSSGVKDYHSETDAVIAQSETESDANDKPALTITDNNQVSLQIPTVNIECAVFNESDDQGESLEPPDTPCKTPSTGTTQTTVIQSATLNSPTGVSASIVTAITETVPIANEEPNNGDSSAGQTEPPMRTENEHTVDNDVAPITASVTTTTIERGALTDLRVFEDIDLCKIIPPDIRAKIHDDPERCCASLVQRVGRCKGSVLRRQRGRRPGIESFSRFDLLSDIPKTLNLVQDMVESALCLRHRKSARNLFDNLKQGIMSLQDVWPKEMVDLVPDGGDLDHDLELFSAWIRSWNETLSHTTAQAAEVKQQSISEEASEENLTILTSSTVIQQAVSIPADQNRAADTRQLRPKNTATVLIFSTYTTKKVDGRSKEELLLRKILDDLTKTDSNKGSIYMYCSPETPGFVKIGMTVGEVDKRILQWSRCQHGVTLCLRADNVPHVRRVEALIHAELNGKRRTTNCSACEKRHVEWFEADDDEAMAVIKKWVAWARNEPYERATGSTRWRLKTLMLAEALERVALSGQRSVDR